MVEVACAFVHFVSTVLSCTILLWLCQIARSRSTQYVPVLNSVYAVPRNCVLIKHLEEELNSSVFDVKLP